MISHQGSRPVASAGPVPPKPGPADAPLLDYIDRADVALNFYAVGTSQRAALHAAKCAGRTFLAILDALAQRPLTPDEVSRRIGKPLLTVRPRMSDLACPRIDGKRIAPFIVSTGTERTTDCGKAAAVMRLTTPEERGAWKPSDPLA